MALTIAAMCERVLDDLGSFEKPTFYVGNSDDLTALNLVSAAKKTGEELVRKYDWQRLITEATITTADGTATYALESDYHRAINFSAWNNSDYERMRTRRTSARWTGLTKSQVTHDVVYFYRFKGNQIELHPTPSGVETLTYEYIKKTYCTDSGGTDQPSGWADDTDLALFPDDLFIAGIRYYFSKANHLPFMDPEDEYYGMMDEYWSKDSPADPINMSDGSIPPDETYINYNFPDEVDTS